ncbi:MAG: ABC transporter substrate-binding protein [Firmicutes bacterium]|nr:ABC transporter substrate-binding protein [Bacillota bacterium]
MKKKTLLIILAVVITVSLVATGCGQKTAVQDTSAKGTPETVKVGYYGGTCEASIYIAHEKGIFQKKGLNVELVKLGADPLKEAIATGKLDVIQVSPALFKPIEQGLDIKVTNGVHTGCIQAVAPVNSSIQGIKDLKGKTIGVDAIGGVPMALLSVELGKLGIDPKNDVTWKAFPGPQLLQALEKQDIDIFATWDPFPELAVKEGKARKIFSTTHDQHYKDQLCCFVGVNGKLAKEKPEVVKAVTEAINEAGKWVQENPKEAARIAVEKQYISGDAETSGQLLGDYKFISDPVVSKQSLAAHLKAMKEQQILDPATDIDKMVKEVFIDMK